MLESLLPCAFICEPAAMWFSVNVIQLVMQTQNVFIFVAKGVLSVFHVALNVRKGLLLHTKQCVESSCNHKSAKKYIDTNTLEK